MIGFITGRVDHIGTNFCLVDTQGWATGFS